jgi:hypothetical protein
MDMKNVALNIGEEMVIRVLEEVVKPYAKELIESSENKYDDMLLPFLDEIVDALTKIADNIDCAEG